MNEQRTKKCGLCRYYQKSESYQVNGGVGMGICIYPVPVWVGLMEKIQSFPVYLTDLRASECKCFVWDE
jgi:hypothetical protein